MPASADSSQKLNHDAIAMARFFSGLLGSFEAAARSLAVEPVTVAVRSDAEIETAITALGHEQDGLVLMDDIFMAVHYHVVISSTLANKVPSIFVADFARNGGLVSYGPDFKDIFRHASG